MAPCRATHHGYGCPPSLVAARSDGDPLRGATGYTSASTSTGMPCLLDARPCPRRPPPELDDSGPATARQGSAARLWVLPARPLPSLANMSAISSWDSPLPPCHVTRTGTSRAHRVYEHTCRASAVAYTQPSFCTAHQHGRAAARHPYVLATHAQSLTCFRCHGLVWLARPCPVHQSAPGHTSRRPAPMLSELNPTQDRRSTLGHESALASQASLTSQPLPGRRCYPLRASLPPLPPSLASLAQGSPAGLVVAVRAWAEPHATDSPGPLA